MDHRMKNLPVFELNNHFSHINTLLLKSANIITFLFHTLPNFDIQPVLENSRNHLQKQGLSTGIIQKKPHPESHSSLQWVHPQNFSDPIVIPEDQEASAVHLTPLIKEIENSTLSAIFIDMGLLTHPLIEFGVDFHVIALNIDISQDTLTLNLSDLYQADLLLLVENNQFTPLPVNFLKNLKKPFFAQNGYAHNNEQWLHWLLTRIQ